MITKEEKTNWLNLIIKQKQEIINGWHTQARRQNICDNYGVNPIDKLQHEIDIVKELREMVN